MDTLEIRIRTSVDQDGNRTTLLFLTDEDGSVALFQQHNGSWGFVTQTPAPQRRPEEGGDER